MPRVRPGWTAKQSVYLRLAAIEYLRIAYVEQRCDEYLESFFQEWLISYGMPTVPEGVSSEAALASLKTRVIATVEWHAFGGAKRLKVSAKARIHALKQSLRRDLFYLWDLPDHLPLSTKASKQANVSRDPSAGLEVGLVAMKL
ncbi:hypothetical protein EST38_g8680 [Candolleomyces aberdarensis]|uniref:Uncharacterized protein n=1 Tax=Candolleomyces aberdarensis TaxID=2316362 RepID=A0A4Q2DE09_9AGAR|nr:hypothetical protein EST38_g8680 [Candolleomyces aberdarensis]